MKIRLASLAGATRKDWLEVIVHAREPALGFGKIRARALPQLLFDNLKTDIQTAEAALLALGEKPSYERDKAVLELRQAEQLLVRAMVIDHDPATFAASVPMLTPDSEGYSDLVDSLLDLGYSRDEARAGLTKGVVTKPFKAADVTVGPETNRHTLVGASEEIVTFYQYCQPERLFWINLLVALRNFQSGASMVAAEVWQANGVKEEDIPQGALLPFPKAQ